MIEPKTFYRELDAALSTIRTEKSDQNFFCTILITLHQTFGPTLHMRNSHIYEKRGNEFILTRSTRQKPRSNIAEALAADNDFIQRVLSGGSWIYDQPGEVDLFWPEGQDGKTSVAAIYVHNPVRRWIFVFELDVGWVYEEITLFLNAVRTAINYRLFSEMMENDLKRAEQIQKSLLPKASPRIPGYQIYGHSQAAEVVGGDFYDYFKFDDQDFGFFFGDASGHGIPAALLARDVVIGMRMGLAKEHRLVYTLEKLNEVIQKSTYATNFVSLFLGEIENDGHLFYVNAGHPPPFIVFEDEITDLDATGITLGFLPEMDLRRSYVQLNPGAVLVVYSDGIVEREKAAEEQFGIARLKELVLENREKTAEELVGMIFRKVYQFGKRTSWEDDASLVVVKRDSS